jgi:phosphomethylpyrimidine synthase
MSIIARNDALQGIIDTHLDRVLRRETISRQQAEEGINAGTMVLLANPNHPSVRPQLVGRPASIKVNANLGASPFVSDPDLEMQKLAMAKQAGAHTVMDLSTGGELDAIRQDMIHSTDLPLGTVPIYAVAQKRTLEEKDPADFTWDELLEEVVREAEQGVDFMTLHCGVTRRGAELAVRDRTLGIVSRGGSILARHMRRRDCENPLLTRYDELLDVCRRHNVTISLGDGLRPGAGADAGDAAQWEEIVALSGLVARARAAGVQAMVEGPGHVPLHLVEAQIRAIKQATLDAPLYVLGPLVTDCAPGYDHIAGAVGGSLAASSGADFLCYLTPAEHLTLPGPDDVWTGVKASLVAAQAAEVAMGDPRAAKRDLDISRARADLDWKRISELALDPCLVEARRGEHSREKECAMCGKFCAIRMLSD